jgi:hypothetical protein
MIMGISRLQWDITIEAPTALAVIWLCLAWQTYCLILQKTHGGEADIFLCRMRRSDTTDDKRL